MKKFLFIMMAVLLLLTSFLGSVRADELMDMFSMRITIEAEDEVYQWKYDSPDYYEFQHEDRVLRAEDAETRVDNMAALVNVNEDVKAETLAKRIKEEFPQLESMDIRWRNGDSELYTWRWEKNEQPMEDS
ncbi:hypothetical protein [Natribacillus halophilus]|uniref:Uncharacterized protein n=1 Tax=Natribacillus halophilus TaxID=549003 RepID=A0A1G8NDF3_9BACI|nr:hypothetical protein [Natribacillus halophilus]SDI78188.1 hypothetical protein SAMN04488123_10620 [Natribacillus halophilus]